MHINALIESGHDVQLVRYTRQDIDAMTVTILDHLNEQTVISLDSLIFLMPQYTWNQIFYAVDQLARCNKVVLRRHRFDYILFSTHFVA